MYVEAILIENFRGIRYLKLPALQATTLLHGPNGSGKTTVLDAVRLVLTGVVRDQTGSALRRERFVGPWGKTGKIVVSFADKDGWKITATLSLNVNAALLKTEPALPGGVNEKRAGIWKMFGLHSTKEALALDPLGLLLGEDVYAQLAGEGDIDKDALSRVFGSETMRLGRTLEQYMIKMDRASDVDHAADVLYNERKLINRDAKLLQGTLTMSPNVGVPQDGKGKPYTSADIPEIKKRVEDALIARGRLDERIARVMRAPSMNDVRTEQEELQQKLDALIERGPLLEDEPEDPPETDYDPEARETTRRALEDVRQQQIQIGDVRDTCPTCGQALDAKMVAAQRRKASELAAERERLEEEQRQHEAAYDRYVMWRNEIEERRGSYERRNRVVQAEHEADIGRLKHRIEKLAEYEPPGKSVDELEEERDKSQQLAEMGQRLIAHITDYEQQEEQRVRLGLLDKETAWLTWLVNKLREPETKRRLGNDQSARFVTGMNEALAMYGLHLRIDWESSTIEIAEVNTERWRPVAEASQGEMTALQLAVADVYAPNGLALIDRFEGLDGTNREQAWNMLRVPVGGRLIAMTATDDFVGIPGVGNIPMERQVS